MRFDLRLHGVTADGQKCQADVSVYASGARDLQKEADVAARTAAWEWAEAPHGPTPAGSQITIERVQPL